MHSERGATQEPGRRKIVQLWELGTTARESCLDALDGAGITTHGTHDAAAMRLASSIGDRKELRQAHDRAPRGRGRHQSAVDPDRRRRHLVLSDMPHAQTTAVPLVQGSMHGLTFTNPLL